MMPNITLTDAITPYEMVAAKRRWTDGHRLGVGVAVLLLVVAAVSFAISPRGGSYRYQQLCPNELESWVYYDGAYFPYIFYAPSDGSKNFKFIAFRKWMIVDDGVDPHEYSNGSGCGWGGFRMEGRGDEGQLLESYELKEDDNNAIGAEFYIDEYPYELYEQGSLFFIWGDDAVSGRTVTQVETDLAQVVPTRESVQAFIETNDDVIDFFKKIAADNN